MNGPDWQLGRLLRDSEEAQIEMVHKNPRAQKQTNVIGIKLSCLPQIMPPSIDNFNLASGVRLHESGSISHSLTTVYDMRSHTHSQTHTHTLGLILPFLKLLKAEWHMCREREGGIERQRETWLGEPQGWGLMTNKLSMCTNTSALQMKYRFSTGPKADEYWLKGRVCVCVCEGLCMYASVCVCS